MKTERPLVSKQELRRRARRGFVWRVWLLLLLITGVAYAAWLAPWARPTRAVQVQIVQ